MTLKVSMTNKFIGDTTKTWKEWRKSIFVFVLIIILALILRFLKIYVGQQPIFGDEAIYIRWAQVMKAEPTLRFLPMSDGKQPLYMWVLMFLLKPTIDPLLLGRSLSMISGLFTLIGIFVLTNILFKSKKISLLASLFYAVSPFAVFFDSMALVDSMLSMFGIWTVIFAITAVKYMRVDFSMLAGFSLGGALLTKSPGIFFSLMLPFISIINSNSTNIKQTLYKLIKVMIVLLPVYIIAYSMYNFLRLGPNFHLIAQRNKDYIFPISHIWLNPKDPFIFHINDIFNWIWLLGPGVLILITAAGLFLGIKNYRKNTLFLSAIILFPLLINSMFAKVFTARYILFTLPYFFVIASLIYLYKEKGYVIKLIIGLFIAHSIIINYLLVYDIEKAPLPKSERTGYLEEWTAGHGIKEIAEYIKSYHFQNPYEKIIIGTEGYFGTLPDGLQIYLSNYPEITVIGVGIDIKELPISLIESKAAGNKTFLVINSSRLVGNSEDMGLGIIAQYPKALRTPGTHDYSRYGERDSLNLFEVLEIVKE